MQSHPRVYFRDLQIFSGAIPPQLEILCALNSILAACRGAAKPERGLRRWRFRRPPAESARHVAAGFRRKKHDGGIQILRLAGALERNAIAEVFDPLFVFVQDFILVGAKPSRRKTVHRDAMLAPIVGKAHGQLAAISR